MLNAIPRFFAALAEKYLPDAFMFALLLTFAVFLAGVGLTESGPLEMVLFWGDGFWNLLEFSMQMAMILISGFALAKTKIVAGILAKIAGYAESNFSAVALVTLVSSITCYINWGFGLICSALLALEIAKHVRSVNYGLLISSAYSGFLVWHGGLSGSIPLKLTSPQDSIKTLLGKGSVGLQDTIYSSYNLTLVVATILTLLALNCFMALDKSAVGAVTIDNEDKQDAAESKANGWAGRIENSMILNLCAGLFFVVYGVLYFSRGGGIGLNMMIFIFFGAALLLHGRVSRFLEAFNESVRGASGILLQFPFYAGIMGMMAGSGLANKMSEAFIQFADQDTFLFFSYLSAGIVNFFVPSGGGQWAIQGPIILPAALKLGVDPVKASMAIAWGDAWTNMVQPFWALPLLAAGKCELRTMMGYSAVVFLAVGLIQSIIFVVI